MPETSQHNRSMSTTAPPFFHMMPTPPLSVPSREDQTMMSIDDQVMEIAPSSLPLTTKSANSKIATRSTNVHLQIREATEEELLAQIEAMQVQRRAENRIVQDIIAKQGRDISSMKERIGDEKVYAKHLKKILKRQNPGMQLPSRSFSNVPLPAAINANQKRS